MKVFELYQNLIKDYSDYIRSFIQIKDSRISEYVEQTMFSQQGRVLGKVWHTSFRLSIISFAGEVAKAFRLSSFIR